MGVIKHDRYEIKDEELETYASKILSAGTGIDNRIVRLREILANVYENGVQSDNYHFLTTTSGTETSGIYNNWSTYNSSDTSHYTGLFGSVGRCFEDVRNYDANYNGVPSGYLGVYGVRCGVDSTLELFKNKISGIRDCMNVPSGEVGPLDSIFYKDTIFGDEYAGLVAREGLEDLMLKSDSATATKYFFDQIITFNEDGSVKCYDMDLILEIMEKSGDDINPGQYDAIALAYSYMNEEEMAQLMCACTNISDDSIENYSKWVVDTEKQTNIYNRLLALSAGYLIMTCSSLDSGDQDLGNGYIETRKELIQKMALWDAFGNIDGYWVEHPNEGPGISIDANDYKNDRVSYVLKFSEYGDDGPNSYFVNSTITVPPCMEDIEMELYRAHMAEEEISSQLVPGFTPEGCEDMTKFVLEHALEFAIKLNINGALNLVPDGYGYAYMAIEAICGGVEDYQNGVEGATVIEENFDEVYKGVLFDQFGINVTPVIYDTAENSSCTYYAQPGVNTVNEIQDFNNDTGENISLFGIINCPEQYADSIMEYYGIIEDEDEENDK